MKRVLLIAILLTIFVPTVKAQDDTNVNLNLD